MARATFFSFHYIPDCWRASQVRNMGVVDGNKPVSDNDWETITRSGSDAIQRWIDGQLSGKSCTIVLIGAATAGRKWIKYEIKKSWDDKKGLVGVYIHRLKDQSESTATKGANPFDAFTVGDKKLSAIVRAYDPTGATSNDVYSSIKSNLSSWVEEAIAIRANY